MCTALIYVPGLHGQTLPATGDVHYDSGFPSVNFGNSSYLSVSGNSKAYIQFDLSSLPPGTNAAGITKVNLVLWVGRISSAGNLQISEAGAAWNESTLTFGNTPATGALVGLVATPLVPDFITVDVTSSVVKWLGNPALNFGFAIEGSPGSTTVYLDSKESVTTSHQAMLSFQQAGPVARPARRSCSSTPISAPAGPT